MALVWPVVSSAPLDDPRPITTPAEGVSAGVDGVVQHLHDAVVGRLAPFDPAHRTVPADHRQLQFGVAQPQKDLPRAAELAELGEDEPDRLLHALVGIALDPIVLAPDEARRQGEAQRATAGLAVPGGQATLAKKAELVFRHRALQAEQQPVVHQARVVDAVRIDDQGAGQRAEIDEMLPVASVARQSRRLDAIDRADGARAEFGDQSLEAGSRGEAGARAAEIVVDDRDGGEAGGARGLGQGVLTLSALEVAQYLRHRRLADVDDGGARQMISADLRAHHRPPRCWSRSSPRWRSAEARRAPRAAPASAAPSATGSDRLRASGAVAPARADDVAARAVSRDGGHPEDDPVGAVTDISSSTAATVANASRVTLGGPRSIAAQAAASIIQRGSSRNRPGRSSTRTMSKRPRRAPSRSRSRCPNSGCHRYATVARTGS